MVRCVGWRLVLEIMEIIMGTETAIIVGEAIG